MTFERADPQTSCTLHPLGLAVVQGRADWGVAIDTVARQYFARCYAEGDVDFVE